MDKVDKEDLDEIILFVPYSVAEGPNSGTSLSEGVVQGPCDKRLGDWVLSLLRTRQTPDLIRAGCLWPVSLCPPFAPPPPLAGLSSWAARLLRSASLPVPVEGAFLPLLY